MLAGQRVSRRTSHGPTASTSAAVVAQACPHVTTTAITSRTSSAIYARATTSSSLGTRHRHAATVRHGTGVGISAAPRSAASSASGRLLLLRGAGAASAVAHRGRGRSGVAVAVSANLFARVARIVTSFFNGLVGSFEDPEVSGGGRREERKR